MTLNERVWARTSANERRPKLGRSLAAVVLMRTAGVLVLVIMRTRRTR